MLVLTRKKNEKILFRGDCTGMTLVVVEVRRRSVRLGFDAPPDCSIVREEIDGKPVKPRRAARQ